MIPTRKEYYVKGRKPEQADSGVGWLCWATLCQTPARYEQLLRQDIERHDPFQHVVTMIQENTHPLWRNVCSLEAYR